MRVAVYGGSFDPPHVGHAMVAGWLRWADRCDEVWLVPSYDHPFGKTSRPFDLRMALCEALAASVEPKRRLDVLDSLVDRVGTTFHPGCLSTCGAARYCRAARVTSGHPAIAGDQAARLMPGVESLPRAVDLAQGATPTAQEAAAAGQLRRANRLLERVQSSPNQ